MNSLVTLALAFTSLFHTALKSSIPSRGASVTSPKAVSLTFTEAVNVNLTTIAIIKTDSSVVETLAVKHGVPAATVTAPVTKPIAPGSYLVKWKTAADDGHVVRGTIAFTVTAGK
jgi:copper resistance protein C